MGDSDLPETVADPWAAGHAPHVPRQKAQAQPLWVFGLPLLGLVFGMWAGSRPTAILSLLSLASVALLRLLAPPTYRRLIHGVASAASRLGRFCGVVVAAPPLVLFVVIPVALTRWASSLVVPGRGSGWQTRRVRIGDELVDATRPFAPVPPSRRRAATAATLAAALFLVASVSFLTR